LTTAGKQVAPAVGQSVRGSKLDVLALAVAVLAAINLIWFIAEAAGLGGDALSGTVEGGRYYLSNGLEVSAAQWDWSRLHASITILSAPLGLACFAYFLVRRVMPFFVEGPLPGTAVAEIVDDIRLSGPVLVSASPGGKVGDAYFSAGMLDVEIRDAGVVLKPAYLPAEAIRRTEITSIAPTKLTGAPAWEVQHKGLGSRSPVLVYGKRSDPLIVALIELGDS
jgi:hypothetical protein